MVVTLNAENFKAEVLEAKGVVLVDFWAPGCGLCQVISPIVDEVAAMVAGQAKVGKVNVGNNMELAQSYSVLGIPTLLIFKNGQAVERLDDLYSKDAIVEKLNSYQTA